MLFIWLLMWAWLFFHFNLQLLISFLPEGLLDSGVLFMRLKFVLAMSLFMIQFLIDIDFDVSFSCEGLWLVGVTKTCIVFYYVITLVCLCVKSDGERMNNFFCHLSLKLWCQISEAARLVRIVTESFLFLIWVYFCAFGGRRKSR